MTLRARTCYWFSLCKWWKLLNLLRVDGLLCTHFYFTIACLVKGLYKDDIFYLKILYNIWLGFCNLESEPRCEKKRPVDMATLDVDQFGWTVGESDNGDSLMYLMVFASKIICDSVNWYLTTEARTVNWNQHDRTRSTIWSLPQIFRNKYFIEHSVTLLQTRFIEKEMSGLLVFMK